MEAVPIDKYFELFKTRGDGGDGGYIRIAMDFHEDQRAVTGGRENLLEHSLSLRREVHASSAARGRGAAPAAAAKKYVFDPDGPTPLHHLTHSITPPPPHCNHRGGFPWKLLLVVAAGAAAVVAGVVLKQQDDDNKKPVDKKKK